MYAGGHWTRPESNADPDHDYAPDTIVLLRVREGDAGYKDPAGNPVPETLFFGKGEAVLVSGNKALPCRWAKKDRDSALRLVTKSGDSIKVPPGHTFLELVPVSTGNVTLSR